MDAIKKPVVTKILKSAAATDVADEPAGHILCDGEPMAYWTTTGKPLASVFNVEADEYER